ncbi:hypothetical protein MPDQ_004379 [Monascus purpureus]|uniref:AMMECR1 domain-containing protein n=1 Tax=Monascus purpureus TaxID=5098 RepID=A0A507QJY7_MONPU|nr:hypothetical protein MPDQ_004379 [Monascus purpureus]BDD60029.1 hypothetical protein MAP00_005195 [Monascus purpureus]
MASPAQCFYCFECLSASFEDREHADLEVIEELWEQYEQIKKLAAIEGNNESVSIGEDGKRGQQAVPNDDDGRSTSTYNRPGALRLPSINHLQSSSESSSAATTPSLASNSSQSISSSSTTLTTPTLQSPASEIPKLGFQKRKYRSHPLFVTWDVLKRGRKSLRGCIGTFEAKELSDGLKSYALISAFEDTRFSPIPESLLPSLVCSLTLLGSFEPCTDAMDWILGTHGIRISFVHRGRRYGATYLPDVPVEQEWTKEETIESLMRKAGWNGATGSVARRLLRGSESNSGKPWEQVSDFRAVKYQGLRASATYVEWQEWRNWVLSLEDGKEKLLNP